jgi:hypothetical protein
MTIKQRHIVPIASLILSLSLSLSACSKREPAPSQSAPAAEATKEASGEHDHSASHSASAKPQEQGKVTLSAEGVSFKPPIKAEALPSGAYYCDMGTVHYARSEQGDGVCPVCKMKLSHKP